MNNHSKRDLYYFQNKNVVRDPESIIKRFNKNEMKNSLLDEGNKAFNNMIKKLSNFKFVNLMIDAATVYNMRVVHSTLSNPYGRLAPLPFRATEKKGQDWDIAHYQLEIETIISEIESFNSSHFQNEQLILVSICHDRLPPQSAAISKVISNLRNQTGTLPIVDVSCLNHFIHNSFLGTIKNYVELSRMIAAINILVASIRKREAVGVFGRKIQNPPQNRWIYLCDVLFLIVQYQESINDYMIDLCFSTHQPKEIQTQDDFMNIAKKEAIIQNDILELFFVLIPLQKASLCLECEQSRLGDAIPIIQTLLRIYQMFIDSSKISLQSSLNILHELLTQLMARFAYLPKESWASCLSRAGRFYLRTKKADSGIVVGDICDYNNQAHSINEAASNMENDIINILNI